MHLEIQRTEGPADGGGGGGGGDGGRREAEKAELSEELRQSREYKRDKCNAKGGEGGREGGSAEWRKKGREKSVVGFALSKMENGKASSLRPHDWMTREGE